MGVDDALFLGKILRTTVTENKANPTDRETVDDDGNRSSEENNGALWD